MLLIERLRRALAPEYDVEREIAGGGMGIVFAARQLRLARRVAIKVLRPELATAIAAERFLAEGRLLARLSHPSIVPVYDAGEADGILYYVMEFIEGETLADRLQRSALTPVEAQQLAIDLLTALGAAHRHGVVHRDVKPQNIFFRDGRALLGDFGIAHWRESQDAPLTATGQVLGTPQYMSPEQRQGDPCTTQSDVYAAGLVLYEAYAGKRWAAYQEPASGDWHRIPRQWVGPFQRALELAPDARWTDSGAFAAALTRKPIRRAPLIVMAAALVAAVVWQLLKPSLPPVKVQGALPIVVERFRVAGPAALQALGDSVPGVIRTYLARFHDFDVAATPARIADSSALRVTGTLTVASDSVRIELLVSGTPGAANGPIRLTVAEPGAGWSGPAERVAGNLRRKLWERGRGTDAWLPSNALPLSDEAFNLWDEAEQLLAEARWEEAARVYVLAEHADSSCYLCTYRLIDINRWLAGPRDSARIARLKNGIGRFPPHYQALIRGSLTPLPARLDTLRNAMLHSPDFSLAAFEYGDELFHRGPLYGHSRMEALEPFQKAVQKNSGFAPAWEHLTWLYLNEGSAAQAGQALASLLRSRVDSAGFSYMLRILLMLGYQWRFARADSALAFSKGLLANPAVAASNDAVAGARLLMTADAPRGAVEFGELLVTTWPGRADAVREGLLGELFGYAALGRLDSMRVIGRRLTRMPDQELPLLALELEAMLRAFDPDPAVRASPDLLVALDRYVTPGPESSTRHPTLMDRALWAIGLLAVRSGDSVRAAATRKLLARGPDGLRKIMETATLAQRGDYRAALRQLPVLDELDAGSEYEDPLADAAVHLLRAESQARLGDRAGARKTLIWFEHQQIFGHLSGPPQPGEMAWAIGTLVRWRLTGVLDPASEPREWCSAHRAVARLWRGANPPFAARADSAERALPAQQCEQ